MNQRAKTVAVWSLRRSCYAIIGGIIFYPPLMVLLLEFRQLLFDSYPNWFYWLFPLGSNGHQPAHLTVLLTGMLFGALIPKVSVNRNLAIVTVSSLVGAYLGIASRYIVEGAAASSAVDRVADRFASLPPRERYRSPFPFHLSGEPPKPDQKDYPKLGNRFLLPALSGGAVCGVLLSAAMIEKGRRHRILLGVAIAAMLIGEAWLVSAVSSHFAEWERECIHRTTVGFMTLVLEKSDGALLECSGSTEPSIFCGTSAGTNSARRRDETATNCFRSSGCSRRM